MDREGAGRVRDREVLDAGRAREREDHRAQQLHLLLVELGFGARDDKLDGGEGVEAALALRQRHRVAVDLEGDRAAPLDGVLADDVELEQAVHRVGRFGARDALQPDDRLSLLRAAKMKPRAAGRWQMRFGGGAAAEEEARRRGPVLPHRVPLLLRRAAFAAVERRRGGLWHDLVVAQAPARLGDLPLQGPLARRWRRGGRRRGATLIRRRGVPDPGGPRGAALELGGPIRRGHHGSRQPPGLRCAQVGCSYMPRNS